MKKSIIAIIVILIAYCTSCAKKVSEQASVYKTQAYVDVSGNDATGELNQPGKPFKTIQAAITVAGAFSIINIGVGTFDAPSVLDGKNNIIFRGGGRPVVDTKLISNGSNSKPTFTAPTQLVGGTILNGTLAINTWTCANLEFYDMGFDTGSKWVTAKNSGASADGFLAAQKYVPAGGQTSQDGIHPLQSQSPPMVGFKMDNCASLGSGPYTLDHGFLFENLINPQISHIYCYFHTHGIAVKTIGGVLNTFEAWGCGMDGLVLKSDDYAGCSQTTVTNGYIGVINNEGGGLNIYGFEGTVPYDLNINNITIAYTAFGINNMNSPIYNIALSNFNIMGTTLPALSLGGDVEQVSIANMFIGETGTGYYAVTINDGNVNLSGVSINSAGSNGYYLTSTKKITIESLQVSKSPLSMIGSNVYGEPIKADSGAIVTGTVLKL